MTEGSEHSGWMHLGRSDVDELDLRERRDRVSKAYVLFEGAYRCRIEQETCSRCHIFICDTEYSKHGLLTL